MLSSLELEWLFFTVKRHGYFLSPHGVPGKHPCDVDSVIDWKQHPMVYRYMYMYTCFVPITCDIYLYTCITHMYIPYMYIYILRWWACIHDLHCRSSHRCHCSSSPHASFTLYTVHFTFYTLHLHSTLYTLHFTLHILHSTLWTVRLALHSLTSSYIVHFTLHTLHSTLYTLHSGLCTPHFPVYTPHFTSFYTLDFTLPTLHSTL